MSTQWVAPKRTTHFCSSTQRASVLEAYFKKVDENGGWPSAAKSVVGKHGSDRDVECYFSTDEDVRDEWNTSFATSDDYYLWKLSEKAKSKLFEVGIYTAIRALKDLV